MRPQHFLDLPLYPGAELADISTERRDDEEPLSRMDAHAKVIVGNYDKVVAYYEEELGCEFEAENFKNAPVLLECSKGSGGTRIYVDRDTCMNRSIDEFTMKVAECNHGSRRTMSWDTSRKQASRL